MLVAVTGAAGLIGSAIIQNLSDKKIQTRSILRSDCDILDMAGLIKAFDGIDVVVHSAGLVSFDPRKKRRLYEINVEGTKNVVNACLVHKTKKLIHISSVAALGKQKPGTIIDEESRWVSGAATSDYSLSKYLSELEVYRGQEEGLNVSIVNPSVVLAPGDGRRSSSHLFGYVWRQRPFFSDFLMNYVDVRDVAEMVGRLLHQDHNGERFIANAGTAPARKILKLMADRFQKRAPGINIPPGVAGAFARLEEFRSIITGGEPLVSRQSVRLLREQVVFENTKAKKVLGMEFQSLENTLDWCCEVFRSFNTNKLK